MKILNFYSRKVAFCFATTEVPISVPSIYFQNTYGQSIKLAKKSRTLILKIFATIEKLSFYVQLLNTMYIVES
jgi:hypothetical protein